MKKRFRRHFTLVLVILFAVLVMIGTFFWMSARLDVLISDSISGYLQTNAVAVANSFKTKLDDQLVMLESQTRYFQDIDMNDYSAIKDEIINTRGIGAFKNIIVADSNGTTIDYNGYFIGNVSVQEYYITAMQGENYIGQTPIMDIDGEEVFVMAVPIVQNREIAGAVIGTFSTDTINSLIEESGGFTNSVSLLVADDGTVFASSSSITEFPEIDKVVKLRLSSGENILERDETTLAYYEKNKEKRIVVSTPVGDYPWKFLVVMAESVITDQTGALKTMLSIVETVNIVAFIIVILTLLAIVKKALNYEKTNDRFMQVTAQSDTIVFDYDYTRNRVEYGGNYKQFFPDGIEVATGEHMWDLLNLLYIEDTAVREAIFNIPNSKDKDITGEARFRCADGHYYWYRLHGTITRNADGSPIRFVGNIVNVEEQIHEELRLKHAAEIDPLTGILNKGAMESHVTEHLNTAVGDELFALYIIDLDNFKSVNDTLGHAIGDKVLTDVARKMGLVFSSQDCIGRIGGDEFSVFLRLSSDGKKNGQKIIKNKATDLCSRIDEIYTDGKHEVHVSASIGVALYPEHGDSYGTLYRKADAALYAAKNSGKNQFFIYSDEKYGR